MEFNKQKSDGEKTKGKIHLGERKPLDVLKENKKKVCLIGASVVLALSGLTAAFGIAASRDQGCPSDSAPTPNAQACVQVDQQTIVQQSIKEKQSVIYRNDAIVYRDDNGNRGEAYINAAGKEVGAGEDFAVHVSLFDQGGISVLVAAGPYAGSRVEFFPVATDGAHVTYSKLGAESMGPDGKTLRFTAWPQEQRIVNTTSLKEKPKVAGSRVTVAYNAGEFGKIVQEDGRNVYAFTLTGSPQKDGLFSVTIWNGDTYAINLQTGRYSVDSIFLFHPDYQIEKARTGVDISRDTIPLINGIVKMTAPAPQTNSAPKP
jgi:hypothetical protein